MLGVLCGLIGIVLMFVFTKSTKEKIPLCGACDQRWTLGFRITIAAVLLFVASLLLLALEAFSPSAALIAIGASFVGLLATIIALRGRFLIPKNIDDETITLAGVHPSALERLTTESIASVFQ